MNKLTILSISFILCGGLLRSEERFEQAASFLLPTNFSAKHYITLDTIAKSPEGISAVFPTMILAKSQRHEIEDEKALYIKAYGSATLYKTLNRFENSGEVGALQFSVDISSLTDYLTKWNQELLEAELWLHTSEKKPYPFDVILSYDSPSRGMKLDGISIDEASGAYLNYHNIYKPLFDLAEGESSGNFMLLKRQVSNANIKYNLREILSENPTQLNVILISNAYGLNRYFVIENHSGIYLKTKER